MNKKANMIIEAGIMIIIFAMLVFAGMSIAETNHRHFCYNKGYHTQEYWKVYNNEDMQKGYFKCCNDKIMNHTITGQNCDTYTEQERAIIKQEKKLQELREKNSGRTNETR